MFASTGRGPRGSLGFSTIELVVVLLLMGTMVAVAIPRALKTSPRREVDQASRQLARDLEQVRLRAMSTKRRMRVSFDAAAGFYAAYMDTTALRSGAIAETSTEARASRLLARGAKGGIPGIWLPESVKFGTGAASGLGPLSDVLSDPISLQNDRVEFDSRGMASPVGTNGTIYITHKGDPQAVAAVTISGAGAFQAWRYRDGGWSR